MDKKYPLKREDPLIIKLAYLLVFVGGGLWAGSLFLFALTGGI